MDGQVLDVRVIAYPKDRDTGADKSLLQAEITRAEAIDPADYVVDEAAMNAMKDQLAIAKSVNTGILYLQYEVDEAKANLEAAINSLVPVAKQGLVDKIAEGEALNSEDYTTESYAALQGALEAGRAILGDAAATPAALEEAIQNITAAMDNLIAAVKGLPATFSLKVGESHQFVPTPAGGTWEIVGATDAFKVTTNSPATVTGEKEGSGILRYTSPQGAIHDMEITVAAASVVNPGGDNGNTGNTGNTGGKPVAGGKVIIPKTGGMVAILGAVALVAVGSGVLLVGKKRSK